MIKANELRIGNWVWDDYSGEMIVSSIIGDKTLHLRKTLTLPEGAYQTHKIDSIPLTEEWLLKAGAIFPYNDHRLQIGNVCFAWERDKLFATDSGYNEHVSINIEFVHTLQNYIFASVGEELTIKE